MKVLRIFDIDLLSLKEKEYQYEYELGESFFEHFASEYLSKGNAKAKVVLEKGATVLTFTFYIEGSIVLTCDRSLEEFDYPFETENKLYFKFGETDGETTDDVIVIGRSTVSINLVQYLYEFIALAVPMKKMHPKYRSEEEESDEDAILIYTSASTDEDSESEEESTDDRWDILKEKFKNK